MSLAISCWEVAKEGGSFGGQNSRRPKKWLSLLLLPWRTYPAMFSRAASCLVCVLLDVRDQAAALRFPAGAVQQLYNVFARIWGAYEQDCYGNDPPMLLLCGVRQRRKSRSANSAKN